MNTYPLVHSFDKDAIERFIDASDDSVKESCRKIIKNTVYVPFEKTLRELNHFIYLNIFFKGLCGGSASGINLKLILL